MGALLWEEGVGSVNYKGIRDNHMSQGFRIIGVKVLEGCSSNIQKNLKAGVLYRFCSDYKASDKDDYTLENSISGVNLDAIYDVKSTEMHKI